MIDIRREIDKNVIGESFSSKKPHIFGNGKTTFKQLKELFTDIFDSRIIKFSKHVPKIDAYLTVKDGNWYVSSYLRPEQQYPIGNASKLNECDDDSSNAVQQTFENIVKCLKSLDPVLLNRFFANGNNRLYVSLVCPPSGCSKLYGDRCFAEYNGIDCFDGKNKVGDDKKSSFQLYKILKNGANVKNEFSEISPEQLALIKKCRDERSTLKQLINQLAKMVDGIGWGCSIYDYVQDRYSRYLVNKALKYGLDVSKKGALVDELTSRLSGTSNLHPTKSDLATFAKREGIDVKSDNYRQFLDDIEQNADQTNKDIILPIENAIYYAIASVANTVFSYASLDPNPKASKLVKQISMDLFDVGDNIEKCHFDCSKLDALKRALQKMTAYKDAAPKDIIIVNGGIPYGVECELDKLDKICGILA